ncbi:MAG: SDR family NAD(P)-dependent oxidoreductase [Syntrophomonadales bacterium]|jgi:NAD(P)-dependent dehydrogenase (short-subunit alcohol dehydrogenase family)
MADYAGKVVAITGAASGIGKGLALRFGEYGAKLSLADINETKLAEVEAELKEKGVAVIADRFDVSSIEDVQRFADVTFATYGGVDYLFNNAGASAGGYTTEAYLKDFEWVFAVNTMAHVYAARAFVPRMVAQDRECHVINTLSVSAFFSFSTNQPYAASKFAALSIVESLELQMREQGTKVWFHGLCPGFVATNFGDIEQNRSPRYALDDEGIAFKETPAQKKANYISKKFVTAGIPVEKCVDTVFKGLEEGQFMIFTHPQANSYMKKWRENLLDGKFGTEDNTLVMSHFLE